MRGIFLGAQLFALLLTLGAEALSCSSAALVLMANVFP